MLYAIADVGMHAHGDDGMRRRCRLYKRACVCPRHAWPNRLHSVIRQADHLYMKTRTTLWLPSMMAVLLATDLA